MYSKWRFYLKFIEIFWIPANEIKHLLSIPLSPLFFFSYFKNTVPIFTFPNWIYPRFCRFRAAGPPPPHLGNLTKLQSKSFRVEIMQDASRRACLEQRRCITLLPRETMTVWFTAPRTLKIFTIPGRGSFWLSATGRGGEEEGLDNEGARNFNVNRFHLV